MFAVRTGPTDTRANGYDDDRQGGNASRTHTQLVYYHLVAYMRPPDDDPLPAHWFQILLALAQEDCHGAAIVRAVLDQTDGRMRLWPVKLYSSLEQMVAASTIVEC